MQDNSPFHKVSKRLKFEGHPISQEVKVTVFMKDGTFEEGGFLFNWDKVKGEIEKILVEHPQFVFEYDGTSKFYMYNETVELIHGKGRSRSLNVGTYEGPQAKGHTFYENGSVKSVEIDLNTIPPSWLKTILRG